MPEPSILDARLAEIDRRLSLIQSGLAPSVEGWANAEPQSYAEAEPTPMGPFAPVRPSAPAPLPFPPPPASPVAHAAGLAEVERIIERLHALTAAHERLLASSRELLSAVADSLARSHAPAPAAATGSPAAATAPPAAATAPPAAATAPPAAATAPPAAASPPEPIVAVAAGPFPNTAALRRFERALSELPGVRELAVREYAGEDRVVIDVHLFTPTS